MPASMIASGPRGVSVGGGGAGVSVGSGGKVGAGVSVGGGGKVGAGVWVGSGGVVGAGVPVGSGGAVGAGVSATTVGGNAEVVGTSTVACAALVVGEVNVAFCISTSQSVEPQLTSVIVPEQETACPLLKCDACASGTIILTSQDESLGSGLSMSILTSHSPVVICFRETSTHPFQLDTFLPFRDPSYSRRWAPDKD